MNHTQAHKSKDGRAVKNAPARKILMILLCLALIRGLIYAVVIPFDRSPDESFYFRLVKAKQLQMDRASEEEIQRVSAEFEVTRYALLYPESAGKVSLENVARVKFLSPPSSSQLYYLVGAWLLKILALEDIRSEIFAIRGFSICCGVTIVLLAFLVTRELFPENEFLLIGIPLVITFLPQFTAMNGVINNDKLAEVFAAALCWCLVKLCKHGLSFRFSLAYLVLMFLALWSKRTTVFSVPLFLMIVFVVLWKGKLGFRMHLLLGTLACSLILGGNFIAGVLHDIEGFWSPYLIWLPPHKVKRMLSGEVLSLSALKYYAKFFVVLYWSFWGLFDYMIIHLHHFWYMTAAFVQFAAFGGVGKLLLQAKLKKKCTLEAWQYKALYLFGVSLILVLGMILYRSIVSRLGSEPVLAQGRRFFTVIIPFSVMTVLGIQQIVPRKYLAAAGAVGVVWLLLLDTVCLSNYLLLNFHLKSLF